MSKRLAAFFGGGLSLWAWALPAAPVALPNGSPLARIAGPPAAQPARLADAGTTASSVLFSVSSHSAGATAGDERFELDGETWEATLTLRRGFASGAELGLELPLIVHENGILDPAIDAYHDLVGLPSGEREAMPTNLLSFRYRSSARFSNGPSVALDNPAAGLGDLSVYAAWPLLARHNAAASLRASVRLPTGDSDRLLGNGALGFSLALTGSRTFSLGGYDGEVYGRAGLLAPSLLGTAVLDDVQEELAGFMTLAATWHRWQRLSLTLQFDSNTPLWDSAISDLGSAPLQFVVAGEWRGRDDSKGNRVVFGFAEDLAIDRSPDIVFFVNWLRRY